MSDYMEFRGKCRELAEAAILKDPTLMLMRGHYVCPEWGEQQHWWTVQQDGSIHDPSVKQFPSRGEGVYVPFDGIVECCECGKEMQEKDAWRLEGRYAYCSYGCYGRFVGVL